MKVKIYITIKKGVFDPQGKAVAHALNNLGYAGVKEVRQGKYIELDLDENNSNKARETVSHMCSSFLANTVTEEFDIKID